jgi:hypothetical protein
MLVEAPERLLPPRTSQTASRCRMQPHQSTWRRIGWSILDALGMRSPHSEDVLGRQAKEDLADSFVVQDPSLSLLRDRVDVTQPSLERIFLEHRH